MATIDMAYDHPTYTTMRQQACSSTALTSAGVVPNLTFRSRVKAIVTGVYAVMAGSIAVTASMILTLLFNGSARAILTLQSTINETMESFTLTANTTLASGSDRLEISTAAAYSADGRVDVVYEYKIAPGTTYSLAAALS
jgi:hypothetical protein